MIKLEFNKIIVYYFSGTGNAKKTAQWVQSAAEQKNINTEIVDISKLEKRTLPSVPENTLIGFCGPTHGFNFPPIMLHFIFRFPRGKQNKVFLINTRAGLKIGKYFIVGLSGITLWLSSFILKIKGFKIAGFRSIDLPSNWISLHPGLKPDIVESIFHRRKNDTIKFINKITDGKNVYTAFKDIIQDIIISPIAPLYYLIGRFVFAKSFIASKECNNCNICIEKCPVNAIKTIDSRCYWTYKCESCMQCMNNCPQRAIETAHGFIIGLSYLINSAAIIWVYKILDFEQITGLTFNNFGGRVLFNIIESVIYLWMLFSGYRLMHYLLKFRFFERLFVFSSFTKYKFWRRYKPSKKIQRI